ncbi:polynucleotide kinase [Glycomyces sp. NPDC048151]|uniref:phosphatase domain-containing protein n=1 Tax=Glycomyces sp. NPDC048151 TaxID=3364002 RepID=UPI003713CC9F
MPKVVIVDIDGTVALRLGENPRKPYAFNRVGEDAPNQPVIAVVEALAQAGNKIVFLSGRDEVCRTDTLTWLKRHIAVPEVELYMRKAGDSRRDSTVKRELYDAHLAHREVLCVIDDRDQVVQMWREDLGLTCLQVAYGDF